MRSFLQEFESEAGKLLKFDGESSLRMRLVLLNLYGWLRAAFVVVIVDCVVVEGSVKLVVSGTRSRNVSSYGETPHWGSHFTLLLGPIATTPFFRVLGLNLRG